MSEIWMLRLQTQHGPLTLVGLVARAGWHRVLFRRQPEDGAIVLVDGEPVRRADPGPSVMVSVLRLRSARVVWRTFHPILFCRGSASRWHRDRWKRACGGMLRYCLSGASVTRVVHS